VALLEVKDLRTVFKTREGEVRAVDGVSFELERGKTLGIVGESGCGKSVTASSIMGIVQPPGKVVGGSVMFDGRELVGRKESELVNIRGREIAMIFQDPMTSLNPVLTIGFQIDEALDAHNPGISGSESRSRGIELLRRVGVPNPDERYDQYPHEFSGGMRQRAMIAMALSCNPSLLIADEPTTALDVTIQAQILELMKDLARRLGVAMLIITHNLGVVARYADRVNVMYAGRIIERASASELYAEPRHPYTLGLLRSVPRLDEPRRARLAPIEGQPPDVTRLPPGCAFAPRCAFRVERCTEEAPPLEVVSTGHWSACWEAKRLAGEAVAAEEPS
jgi:oligopeptide/dipeptide ABC transporter ATP-binding protein